MGFWDIDFSRNSHFFIDLFDCVNCSLYYKNERVCAGFGILFYYNMFVEVEISLDFEQRFVFIIFDEDLFSKYRNFCKLPRTLNISV